MLFEKDEIVAVWVPSMGRKVWWLARVVTTKGVDLVVRWFSKSQGSEDTATWKMNAAQVEVGYKYVLVRHLQLDAGNRLTMESRAQIDLWLERHLSAYGATEIPLDKYHQNCLFADAAIAVQNALAAPDAKDSEAKDTVCAYLDHIEFGTTKVLLERKCLWPAQRMLVPQYDFKAYKKMVKNSLSKQVTLRSQTLKQLVTNDDLIGRIAALLADYTCTWATCAPDIKLAFSKKVFARLGVLMITISLRANVKFDVDANGDYKALRRDILLAQIDIMRWAQLNGYLALPRNIPDRWGTLQPAIINGTVAFIMFDISTPTPTPTPTPKSKPKLKLIPQTNVIRKPKRKTEVDEDYEPSMSRKRKRSAAPVTDGMKRIRYTSARANPANDPDNYDFFGRSDF